MIEDQEEQQRYCDKFLKKKFKTKSKNIRLRHVVQISRAQELGQ